MISVVYYSQEKKKKKRKKFHKHIFQTQISLLDTEPEQQQQNLTLNN